jgi:hypothetical protein
MVHIIFRSCHPAHREISIEHQAFTFIPLASPIMSQLDSLPETVPDAAFALIEQFKADDSPQRVDLSPGFYRDENAKPWILPSVQQVDSAFKPLTSPVLTTIRLSELCSPIRPKTTNIYLCSVTHSCLTKHKI